MSDLHTAVRARLDGRPLTWLANRLGLAQSTLSKILGGQYPGGQHAARVRRYAATGELPAAPTPQDVEPQ